MRSIALAVLLWCVPVFAGEWKNGIDGVGHATLLLGWKLTPNDFFFNNAGAAGTPVVWRGVGGPQGALSFGYGATSFIEATIDVFVGNDRFQLQGSDSFVVMTYGALLGVTLKKMDLFASGLWASLTAQLGPTLGYVSWPQHGALETLTTGYSASVGIGYRLTDRVGLEAHYRFVYARAGVPNMGGLNAGGSFFSLGLVILFPRDASADLPAGT